MNGAFNSVTLPGLVLRSTFVGIPAWKHGFARWVTVGGEARISSANFWLIAISLLVAVAGLYVGRRMYMPAPAVEPLERQRLLEHYILGKIAAALKISPSRLDAQQPLNSLGLDSLTAVELRNWIEAELNVEVPITILLQEPTIAQFSAQLLEQLTGSQVGRPQASSALPIDTRGQGNGSTSTPGEINQRDAAQLLEQLDQLSDEEVEALLGQLSPENVDGHEELPSGGEAIHLYDDHALRGNKTNGSSQRNAAQLLAGLDQLSDEEVDSLLSQMLEEETEK